jgi:hypothetical protein
MRVVSSESRRALLRAVAFGTGAACFDALGASRDVPARRENLFQLRVGALPGGVALEHDEAGRDFCWLAVRLRGVVLASAQPLEAAQQGRRRHRLERLAGNDRHAGSGSSLSPV